MQERQNERGIEKEQSSADDKASQGQGAERVVTFRKHQLIGLDGIKATENESELSALIRQRWSFSNMD